MTKRYPVLRVVSKACSHRNLLEKLEERKKGKKGKSKKKRVEAETTPSNDIVDSKTTVNNPTGQPNRNTGDLFPLSRPGVNQAGKSEDAFTIAPHSSKRKCQKTK